MDKYIPYTLHRAALTLLMMLAITLTASATDFITDVMVAGHSNQNEFNTLIQNLQGQGWTDISQDLNQGCGSSSYYIHLLYKKQSSSGNTGVSITDFYVRTGANPPDNLTYGGRTYYLAPCQGNDNFVSGHGDLNAGCGSSSDYIFLYYTKDALSSNTGVTVITFNTTQSGAVGANGGTTGYDLNSGAHGSYIYMHLTTASGGNVVTLSSGSGNVALQNGHILTGTGGTETQVTIADGATVTFNGVNNTAIPDNSSHPWPGISCLGNATIVLNGSTTNSVKGGRGGSGIHVAVNKALTIQGSGTLNATGGYRGAGIGGGWGSSCGNITISGGTVTATGGEDSAGIGSGYSQSSCGNITINGGTITATGGQSAAGIGSGYYNSSCGNITITNGVTRVTATKGQSSNNTVGAGNSSTCGTVTIGGVQTGNITLSPFVTYPYTVAFDANGGTGTMANMSFMYNVAQNLTANSFSRTNYSFDGWATSATGQKVYNDGQSVSNLTQNSGATVTLYAKWMPNAAHLSVSGNEYTIHTATGWNLFCDLLAENSNGYFTGKTVKLGTDIGVTRMAGSSGHEFSGTFDGQEHMLLVLFQNTNNNHRTAPFSYVNGATIQNLVVAGSITGTADRAAGIVGETGNSLSHVTNCVSSVNVSGGQYTAGISIGGKVEITGCLFNGTITGTSMSGGFVGSSDNALVISNCLFAPQEGSTISGGTFYYNGGGEITLVNSYYTTSLGTPQGKQAHSIAAGENVTLTINNQVTATYSVSGISAYSAGIGLTPLTPSPEGEDEVFYAGEGDAVSLNLGCTIPANYTFFGYQASEGTFTGTENPYTLTMPDADVTIQAILELIPNSINYIDGDSVTHTCNNFTVLLGNETTLEEGWYVVYSDLTYDHTLTLNGDVTFILRNGKTMTVAPESGEGLYGFQKSLTLYGQSLNSNEAGTLHVIGNGSNIAIKLLAGTYTQHSGKVIVSNSRRDAFYADNITMNGGCINASIDNGDGIGCIILTINGGNIHTNSNYGYGIYSSNLTFNGGKVEASRIYCEDNITLGWINTDDYIHAGRYEADGTISVKSGQAFYYEENDEQVIVSGTLNSGQIQAIGGKTLRPYYVNYMDGDGEVYICKNFTVLTGEEKTLDTGWYVVDHDIAYDSTLTLNGDVTLILCNGMTMTVTPESGSGIQRDWNNDNDGLTIYGQRLDSLAGNLNVTNNDWQDAISSSNYIQHSGNVIATNSSGAALCGNNITMYGGSIHVTTSGTIGISAAEGGMSINGGSINVINVNEIGYGIFVHHITMNGGSINANGESYGIIANEAMTINGGSVTANQNNSINPSLSVSNLVINGGKVEVGKIAFDTITLGWTNTDDYIHASGYYANFGKNTVSVKSSQNFYYQNGDDIVIVSGTLDEDQIDNIGGKTLRPYTVNYMDGNGETHICKYFTVLTGEEKTLDEGWYVVDHDITYDSTLTLNDSVTLILCNGMTMTVNADNGDGIEGVSMTLYGQSLDSDVAGTLNVTSNDEEGIALVLQNFTLHSGNVVASSQNRSAIDYCPLTVYGGSINARGRTNGISSSLTVYGGSINARGDENGINSNLIVHDGSVFANGGERGIMSRNVTIHGGTVTANGDNYGIHTVEMNIDGGNIEANGSAFGIEINGTAFGIPTNDLLVNGGTVIANGRDYGIRTYAGIVINDGTVTVTAGDNFGNDESGEDKSDGDALGRGIHAAGDVIINGGIATVTVAGIDYGDLLTGRGIHADGDVIINDGLVTANSNVIGIHAYSNMIINGGKVEASRIYCESNITLGWTNTDDYIRAGGYTANYGDGIISVKSCQAFYYDNNVLVIGTLDEGQIQAIEGKTLQPYPLASYTLEPTAYTLTNGGYTDIPCTLSSLELDKPVWDGHSLVQVSSLSFYMNGGTLTDGAGHSIPFLVDKWPHSGAAAQMAQGDDFSSEGATFIMAVYIDPEVYDAAAPGTYTGEFVYDSYWNPSTEKSLHSIPGVSGSIALTLVIPETITVALSAGWNWWTPLVETTVNALQTVLGDTLQGIKSEAGPIVSGTLVPGQLYKIQTSAACTLQLTGTPVTSVSVTFQQGVNWFGYTGADNLPIASALGSFTPALGDKIVSQNDGFVLFTNNGWEGTLPHLVPGQGYVYVSTTTTRRTWTMKR